MVTMRSTFLALVLVGGCGLFAPNASMSPKAQRDVITREEILSSTHDGSDLYQAIQSLRPHFLAAPRGVNTAAATTTVYIDGARQSGLESLRTIRSYNVDEVRYLDPATSRIQIGPMASGGAVMVKLHTSP